MSENIITLEKVSKTFRRFQHPGWRAFDALGFHVPKGKFDEFMALSGIDLTISRGEKVALIGRNGAGKSTLLRLISKQMAPDVGNIQVRGNIQALMELGTGFHPDFTGIQNIRSALTIQGLTTQQINELIPEIIDFTELDDFINRPVREYSAGMYSRLAFAVATSISPDILIIDEILGAGDAYFVGKCIQRMKLLTNNGATILFVSHDMSAVHLLCERAVWVEKGKVRLDGDVLAVSKAYLASVREDEEKRIRAKSMSFSKAILSEFDLKSNLSIFRLIRNDMQNTNFSISVSEIRFGIENRQTGLIKPTDTMGENRFIVESGYTDWSGIEVSDAIEYRTYTNLRSKYNHAPWQIQWQDITESGNWIEIDYKLNIPGAVDVQLYDFDESIYKQCGQLVDLSTDKTWKTIRFNLKLNQLVDEDLKCTNDDLQHLESQDRYGDGPIKIKAFGFFDQYGERRHTLITGEPAYAVLNYAAEEQVINPVAVIAIYRYDGTCALQVTSNRHGFTLGQIDGHGKIYVNFPQFLLGPGEYIVSIALFKDLNVRSKHESEAYDLHDRCYALNVLSPPDIGVEIGIVNQPTEWNLVI